MKTVVQKRNQAKDQDKNLAKLRATKSTTTMAGAAAVDPNKPLTDQQKLFVKSWATGETIPNAMARAGYNDQPSYGYRMAKMPNILALYNAEKALYEESCQMTRKKVMDGLLEGVEMAKMMAEPATVINGWKTIGQMAGYFNVVQKVDVNITGNVAYSRMAQLSDAELLKLIEAGNVQPPHLEAPSNE